MTNNNVIVLRNKPTKDILLEIYRVIDRIAQNHPDIADSLYYKDEELKNLNFIDEEWKWKEKLIGVILVVY